MNSGSSNSLPKSEEQNPVEKSTSSSEQNSSNKGVLPYQPRIDYKVDEKEKTIQILCRRLL